jgi:hypothetical protein
MVYPTLHHVVAREFKHAKWVGCCEELDNANEADAVAVRIVF